jgi:hypothetical protein
MIRCDIVVYLQVVFLSFSLVLIWSPCKGGIFVLWYCPRFYIYRSRDCADSLQLVSPAINKFNLHLFSLSLPLHLKITGYPYHHSHHFSHEVHFSFYSLSLFFHVFLFHLKSTSVRIVSRVRIVGIVIIVEDYDKNRALCCVAAGRCSCTRRSVV